MEFPHDSRQDAESTINPYASPRANLQPFESEAVCTELAGRWVRLGADLLDELMAGIPALLLMWACCAALGYSFLDDTNSPPDLLTAAFAVIIGGGVFIAFNGYLLARHGQTIGKRICRIRILREDGTRATLWDTFVKRQLPIRLLMQIPHVGWIFTLIDSLFIFREDRRCLHDWLAGTIVVRTLPSPATTRIDQRPSQEQA
jgi:uncharacterized RDD family membrane protein YckC